MEDFDYNSPAIEFKGVKKAVNNPGYFLLYMLAILIVAAMIFIPQYNSGFVDEYRHFFTLALIASSFTPTFALENAMSDHGSEQLCARIRESLRKLHEKYG